MECHQNLVNKNQFKQNEYERQKGIQWAKS